MISKSGLVKWLKKNWVLLVVIFVLFGLMNSRSQYEVKRAGNYVDSDDLMEAGMLPQAGGGVEKTGMEILAPEEEISPSESAERLVVKTTSLSMVVKDVVSVVRGIEQEVIAIGGFLVESSVNTPEEGGTGYISVRVPAGKLQDALTSFKNQGVRVVSENVQGRDVTDQYEDLEERLELLANTKTKFEGILASASEIRDILQVQREIVSLQRQIDNVKGRQEYLSKTAELSLVTVYLSTDELELPYSPGVSWKPKTIFKQAVRSLVQCGRGLVSMAIWLVVYSPVWLGVLIIWKVWKKRVGK